MGGIERILSFAGVVLLAMLLPLVISSGRYGRVDPGRSQEKKLYEGDLVPIFANKVYPRENRWYNTHQYRFLFHYSLI